MNPALRAELIACIEAGAVARGAGVDHRDNPHLLKIRPGSYEQSQSEQVQRCEAWWDVEEVDRAFKPWRIDGQVTIAGFGDLRMVGVVGNFDVVAQDRLNLGKGLIGQI